MRKNIKKVIMLILALSSIVLFTFYPTDLKSEFIVNSDKIIDWILVIVFLIAVLILSLKFSIFRKETINLNNPKNTLCFFNKKERLGFSEEHLKSDSIKQFKDCGDIVLYSPTYYKLIHELFLLKLNDLSSFDLKFEYISKQKSFYERKTYFGILGLIFDILISRWDAFIAIDSFFVKLSVVFILIVCFLDCVDIMFINKNRQYILLLNKIEEDFKEEKICQKISKITNNQRQTEAS